MKPALPAAPDATYRNAGFFVLFLLAFVVWGFYQSYFSQFPTFPNITTVQHWHGALLLSWFALLIVQPFLIKYRRYALHRSLGKASYVLIPLIVLSIVLVARAQFLRQAAELPPAVNVSTLALPLPQALVFGTLYVLAMLNRKRAAYHMRYMVATALLMLGPGTGRAFIQYFHVPFPVGLEYSMAFTELLGLGLLLFDLRRGRPWQPYAVALGLLAALHLIWEFRMAPWWQGPAGAFARLF